MNYTCLLQGEARAVPLASASVHAIVTSPPYWSLRDYGTGVWTGGDPACTHTRRTSTKDATITTESRPSNVNHEREGWRGGICGRCGATRVDQQLGLEAEPDCDGAFTGAPCGECYICHMRQVFREIWRVLRHDGCLWVNMGDSYNAAGRQGHGTRTGRLQGTNGASASGEDWCRPSAKGLKPKDLCGIPWRLALALQRDGWTLRADVIWHKVNPMPESVWDRPGRAHEHVFLLTKAEHYFYDSFAVRQPGSQTTHTRFAAGATPRKNGTKWAEKHGGSRPNEGLMNQVIGRNLRTVWSFPSEPTHNLHFATFPTALVERCLRASTSAHGCCPACGTPSVRVVTRQRLFDGQAPVTGTFARPEAPFRIPANGRGHYRYETQVTEDGWEAGCPCDAGAPVPSTVFDPFCGSGTTLLVARQLGLHSVGMDLSWPYLHQIARQRLGLADLHAWLYGRPPRQETFDDLPLFGAS